MVKININEATSYGNYPALMVVYHQSWQLKEINISYNCQKGIPEEEDYENYPFKARFQAGQTEIELRIRHLTVGYQGTGPHDLMTLLDFFGVEYERDDILTQIKKGKDGYIRLKYTF